MQTYEILLHTPQSQTPLVYRLSQTSNFAAIRKARKLAEDAKAQVEVWTDRACIYAGAAAPQAH